jgi:hypothetical protein
MSNPSSFPDRSRLQFIRSAIAMASLLAVNVGIAAKPESKPPIPNTVALKFDRQLDLRARSQPIRVGTEMLSVVKIGRGTFHLDQQGHLTGTLKGGVLQFHKMTYWIHAAVFDGAGNLLGVASHREQVQNIRTGAIITVLSELPLDFGISRRFKSAKYVVVSVGDRGDSPAR